MKTKNLLSIQVVELSHNEMTDIYGGGWLIDLLQFIDKNYTEFKKGLSDGYHLR